MPDQVGHHHVLQRGQLGKQMIELEDEAEHAVAHRIAMPVGTVVDPLAVDQDRSRVGGVEQAQDVQERALARAAGTHHGDHLAAFDLQVDPAEDRNLVPPLPVTLAQTDRRDMSCHRPRLPWEEPNAVEDSVSWYHDSVPTRTLTQAARSRSFKSQGLHGVQPGRALSRPDAGQHGDEQCADDDPDHRMRLDQGRDLVEIVDRVVKDLATQNHTQDLLDLVDVADEEQAADHADPAAHRTQQAARNPGRSRGYRWWTPRAPS